MGLGLQTMVAKRVADRGESIEAAIAAARRCYETSHVLFAVDTLEYLHRGGRIGGAARLVGSALNLKPVLTISDGRVEALEKRLAAADRERASAKQLRRAERRIARLTEKVQLQREELETLRRTPWRRLSRALRRRPPT